MFSIFGNLFSSSKYEKKRAEYQSLYGSLGNQLESLQKVIKEFEDCSFNYQGNAPVLDGEKVPSIEFLDKRVELDRKLNEQWMSLKKQAEHLSEAKNRAYEQYLYYDRLVQEEERKEREEREEREG